MKKILTLMAFTLVCTMVYAQTMHTLIFVNTQENTEWGGDRTVDRTQDYDNMKEFFSKVANSLGYVNDMRAHRLQSDFTQAAIDREINNLNVRKNDIVVFYYSGHGANSGTDIWPSLCLMDNEAYWQTEILRKLKSRCSIDGRIQTKLLLCIADCCNNVYDGNIRGSFGLEENTIGLKKLFTGFTGRYIITMSASQKGYSSISNSYYGALFGIALREAITTKTANKSPTWEDVLELTDSLTAKFAKIHGASQMPQHSIKISGDPMDY